MKARHRSARWTTRLLQVAGVIVVGASAAATLLLLPHARFEAPAIRVDQIGYRPADAKPALWVVPDEPPERWPETFRVLEATSGEVVWEGDVPREARPDPASGDVVVPLDFTPVATPGEYTLELDGLGESEPFRIADAVYAPLFRQSLKALTFQRCGTAVEVGDWSHRICHRARVLELGADETLRPLAGGWHDAGNYDRYVPPAVFAVWQLLMTASPLFPRRGAWSSDALGLPESGNGVPDVLDEARWELDWLLRMQRPDGGVHHKLAKIDWTPVLSPSADHERQYLFPVSSAATAGLAAVASRAARAYRELDPAFADRCLAAARSAWSWLEANPEIVPEGGFRNPSGVRIQGGEYGDANDRDERFWAAAELWATTGEAQLEPFVREGFQRWPHIVERPMTWSSFSVAGFLAVLEGPLPTKAGSTFDDPVRARVDESAPPPIDDRVQWGSRIRTGLAGYAGGVRAGLHEKGYPTALGGGDFLWGSNAYALSAAVLLVIADALETAEAEAAAQAQLHYVLGLNALGRCFVTGFGWDPPRHPHHHPSETDDRDEPVPGFLVGGPTASQPGDGRPARRYLDSFESYHSNEVAINWNAPLVFLAGYWTPPSRLDRPR